MNEGVGNFSFENEGVFNPYDRHLYAQQLATDCIGTIIEIVAKRYEEQGGESVQPNLDDDRVVLAEEVMAELVDEIEKRDIVVVDNYLVEYMNTPTFTIDDENFDPRQDIPWFKILKSCGFSQDLVKASYDMSNSALPAEHMNKIKKDLK